MRRAFLLVAAVLMAGAPAAVADTTEGSVTASGSEFPYLLYTPDSYRKTRPVPLLVVLHGCQTTAAQEQQITQFDALAEREGFVVLYAEVDALGAALPGPLENCWKFFDPSTLGRGNGDTAAIRAMTGEAMTERAIDPERVYVVGVSAGGLMASAQSAAYPEVYAAEGLVASAGYADAPCFTTGVGVPVALGAQLAFEQMGDAARVVPRFVIGSLDDLAFPASCSEKAAEQALRTANLVLSGGQDGPLALTPAALREEQVPDGHPYTVAEFRDPEGCLVGERTIIDGMPHAWPGGTTDPELSGYADPRAPDGATIAWAFLSRYTRSGTALPCAEAPVRVCAAHRVVIRLPRAARRIRVTVDGRRVKARRTRRGVRVRVPAGATVVVKARKRGERITRRRAAPGC